MLNQQNQQPAEKRVWRKDGVLDVVKVWETIQGEGPFAGLPAVFVRMAGCNLDCQLCDTDYTSNRTLRSPSALIETIEEIRKPPTLVVLTGGEPFRQNFVPFVGQILSKNYMVQIETNGTYWFEEEIPISISDYLLAGILSIVVSPKSGSIRPEVELLTVAFKYILRAGEVAYSDGLPTRVLGRDEKPARPPQHFPREKVFVQPCDEGSNDHNQDNIDAALDSCMKYGYRLSLQTHKLLGLE